MPVGQDSPQPPVLAGASASGQKALQTQALAQLEAITAQTPSSPFERAKYIHDLKAAYIKARFTIDPKGGA